MKKLVHFIEIFLDEMEYQNKIELFEELVGESKLSTTDSAIVNAGSEISTSISLYHVLSEFSYDSVK